MVKRIVVAPDKYKECMTAVDVCQHIEAGLRRALGAVEIDKVPMADGGEGTVEALVSATGGTRLSATVTAPLGDRVQAPFGILGDGKTAVIEMASASGLALVPPEKRNPMLTTTYGTGELIKEALETGVGKVICGIGGSSTNDAGVGMAMALGGKFLDPSGKSVGFGGGELKRIATIDLSSLHPRISQVEFLVACDVDNPLTGERGAACVYAPQKGATPDMVRELDEALRHLASLIRSQLHIDVERVPGAGAAGGLGAGMLAFLGARLVPGTELVIEAVNLPERIKGSQLVITGEGKLDSQSLSGKTVYGVARVASELGVPVIAIAGSIAEDAHHSLRNLLSAYFSIINSPMTLEEAIRRAPGLLESASEQVARLLFLGYS